MDGMLPSTVNVLNRRYCVFERVLSGDYYCAFAGSSFNQSDPSTLRSDQQLFDGWDVTHGRRLAGRRRARRRRVAGKHTVESARVIE
jgi:hypothetical protein